MAQGTQKMQPIDLSTINIKNKYELLWWCEKLGCSRSQIEEAMKSVGSSAMVIINHFGKKDLPAW